MIVVDTNIIAYFVIGSDHTLEAEAVFTADPDWSAPLLWKSEMRNLLTIYLRRKEMTLDDACTTMDKAKRTVQGREFEVRSDRVLKLSEASGCTAYDCEFVSVAQSLDIPLVTADRKVLAAFPDITRSMKTFADQSGIGRA